MSTNWLCHVSALSSVSHFGSPVKRLLIPHTSSSFPIPCYLPVSGSSVHLLNPFLSFANLSISLTVFPFSLPNSSIPSSHVFLGRPLPLCPIGLAPNICFGFLSSVIIITCPTIAALFFICSTKGFCFSTHNAKTKNKSTTWDKLFRCKQRVLSKQIMQRQFECNVRIH